MVIKRKRKKKNQKNGNDVYIYNAWLDTRLKFSFSSMRFYSVFASSLQAGNGNLWFKTVTTITG